MRLGSALLCFALPLPLGSASGLPLACLRPALHSQIHSLTMLTVIKTSDDSSATPCCRVPRPCASSQPFVGETKNTSARGAALGDRPGHLSFPWTMASRRAWKLREPGSRRAACACFLQCTGLDVGRCRAVAARRSRRLVEGLSRPWTGRGSRGPASSPYSGAVRRTLWPRRGSGRGPEVVSWDFKQSPAII